MKSREPGFEVSEANNIRFNQLKPETKDRNPSQNPPCKSKKSPNCAKLSTNAAGFNLAKLLGKGELSKEAQSVTNKENTLPKRASPKGKSVKPKQEQLCTTSGDSDVTKSTVSKSKPGCKRLFNSMSTPSSAISATGREDTGPGQVKPTASETGSRLAEDHVGKGKPKSAKSNTSIRRSALERLLINKNASKVAKSAAGIVRSRPHLPKRSNELPIQALVRSTLLLPFCTKCSFLLLFISFHLSQTHYQTVSPTQRNAQTPEHTSCLVSFPENLANH